MPDIIGPGVVVLLVGINPGLTSQRAGHNFATPGNRFWPALHGAGLTPRRLAPGEGRELLKYGVGLTKLVRRPTATAAELTAEELRAGGERVRRLVRRLKPPPRAVCFLGIGAYCSAYGLKAGGGKGARGVGCVRMGLQPGPFEGAALWVLPNPSGLNANYQLPDYVRMLREVRESVGMVEAVE